MDSSSICQALVLSGIAVNSQRQVPSVVGIQLAQLVREVTLGELLGAGNSGKVFKAKWRGSTVALKLMVRQ
jgi:hypothetical protein